MRVGGPLRRCLRRNPLRRRSDVVEGWTVLCLTGVVLVGAPVAGVAAGAPALAAARAESRAAHAESHSVRAELLDDAPPLATWAGAYGSAPSRYRVPVRWTTDGGVTRTGSARVSAGTRRGEHTELWLDRRGRPTRPPPEASDVWLRSVTVGMGAASGVTAVAVLTGWSVRRRLDRGRLAAWEREWASWA
ncbi:hypothetical protein GTY65_41270 [Streptomyces sp. SID8379]|uniref:Rv1733c family protein n=1 Tax=unclassified Streptomyces TaxID=2593676 RepID=UPI00036059A7|nr:MULTISPECIES: hypothetical protein [unclassified Streptomyces]MYW70433.1 hypothetical protein [Streptomyces sp. SID8379]